MEQQSLVNGATQEMFMKKTDSQIQADVMQALAWDPSISHEKIGVSASEGVVTLSGSVPSYFEKSEAEKVTQRMGGVRAIVEKIEVKLSGSSMRDDQDIAEAILSQLDWTFQVPKDSVKASVENGWVELRGEVEWQYQRNAALNCIKDLKGVRGVSNLISLKEKSIDPAIIKGRIEAALKAEAQRESKRISVAVNGSTVTLTGNVNSFADKDDARWAAWGTPGVRTVENNLQIN
jgi:osmotically-inducible protein OsmY